MNIDRTQLTAREQEVLTLRREGFTYQQIADRLGIARGTVVNHMCSIRDRLRGRGRLPWRLTLADIAREG